VGLNVPRVHPETFLPQYIALHQAINSELVASCHAVARGGLAVHLALAAMGGALGVTLRLPLIPALPDLSNTQKLYSESCGRFVITVAPEHKAAFEACFSGMKLAEVGMVTESPDFMITGDNGDTIINENIHHLKDSWKKPFGDLI
jgi:phosphoribosylformylglycinamidine synthase